MQVATRAMTPTGMYRCWDISWELKVPTGVSSYVDGVLTERAKAVREQIMLWRGLDQVIYSDRKYHFEADGVLHSMVNFTDEEARAIVDETHRLGKKKWPRTPSQRRHRRRASRRVDTIEHGDGLTEPGKWMKW